MSVDNNNDNSRDCLVEINTDLKQAKRFCSAIKLDLSPVEELIGNENDEKYVVKFFSYLNEYLATIEQCFNNKIGSGSKVTVFHYVESFRKASTNFTRLIESENKKTQIADLIHKFRLWIKQRDTKD